MGLAKTPPKDEATTESHSNLLRRIFPKWFAGPAGQSASVDRILMQQKHPQRGLPKVLDQSRLRRVLGALATFFQLVR